ncbi:unnamed protein product [Fusarium graminearum]|nr:unnamed protein product [Fusarium graminearum]CAF3646979.1 unnamed protein product [Fusarium graminearum]CAG1970071.1 unnamed protein product [Fusarium graminearum]CAG1973772.1 unnamed protein product [Fusarium graminearum]
MDFPHLDQKAAPIRFPDCCLALSTKLLQILSDIFSKTTSSEDKPTVLSIGSGSGLLEAFLQDQQNSSDYGYPSFNVEGVEVQQQSGKDAVNKYLPEPAIYTVRGSWDVVSRLQDPDVTSLMFVYPRQPALILEYTKAIARRGLNVQVIVWLGPMADWEVFGSCFDVGHEIGRFAVTEKRQGADAGLDDYEMMALSPMLRRVVSIMTSSSPKRFIPLKKRNHSLPAGTPSLRGVVFDMDGTLCEPQTYMFKEMRDILGINKTTDILEYIETLPKSEQSGALESIRNIERKAMRTQTPQPGLMTLMAYLDTNAIPKAICTRNFDVPVQNLMEKFLEGSRFHPIVTRDFHPPKPDPAGILYIAKDWGLTDEAGEGDASGLIMVGDSIDDMTAGRKAGAATVLLVNDVNRPLAEHAHTDLVINTLDELVAVLDDGFVGREVSSE